METTARNNTTLGLSVLVPGVPVTCEGYNELAAPRTGNPCLEDAVNSTIYRSWNTEFRETFVDKVAEVLKAEAVASADGNEEAGKPFDRAIVKYGPDKKDAETGKMVQGNPVYEQDGAFLDRILGIANKKVTEFQSVADEVAAGIAFDPSPSTRTGRLPKAIEELLEKLHKEKTPEQLVTIAANIERLNPGVRVPVADGVVDRQALGRGLKLNAERAAREAADSLG